MTLTGYANDLAQSYWSEYKLTASGGLYKNAAFGAPGPADYSQLLRTLTITESSGTPARQCDIILDNTQQDQILFKDQLAALCVGTGFFLYGHKMDHFYGTIGPTPLRLMYHGKCFNEERDDNSQDATRTYTTYDLATMLARTETARIYNAMTMSEILGDMHKVHGIKIGVAVDTEIKVGQIITGSGWTLARVLQEASDRTFDRTGRRFFIRTNVDEQSIDLLEFGHTGVTWQIREGGVITAYLWNESAEDTRTELRMVDEQYNTNGAFQRIRYGAHALASGPILDTFGKMTSYIAPDGSELDPTLTDAEQSFLNKVAQAKVDKDIKTLARTVKSATTTSLYLPGARRGDTVIAGTPRTGGVQTWYIDTIVHSIDPTQTVTTCTLVKEIGDSGGGDSASSS